MALTAGRRRLIRRVPAYAVAALLALAALSSSDSPAQTSGTRDVMLVGSNHSGIVDIIDPVTLEKLHTIDVAPDYESCLDGPATPDQSIACTLNNELAAEGEPQLVDDLAVSPDGRTIYVSRPSMGDVAAFDMVTGKMVEGWPVQVSGTLNAEAGRRSDHMALSPDGTRLLVSATVANVVDVIDTASAEIVKEIPTGDFPHENRYSADGELIYNGSIGRVVAPDNPELDAAKSERVLTIADADTFKVERVIDFREDFGRNAGIRPFEILPDNRTMYVQLSFFNGLVEYDLEEERPLRTLHMPLRGADPEGDFLDSMQHGLAISGDRSRLCVAGTVSDYAAIIDRETLTVVGELIDVGDLPYWAATTPDGSRCFVPSARADEVTVISYADAEVIDTIEVGTGPGEQDDFPQRIRAAAVAEEALAQ